MRTVIVSDGTSAATPRRGQHLEMSMAHPLNPAQARAVGHRDGPLLVLAGAGSGKTRVITHRIARLLESGIPAKAIVAVTFTNKAAGEMRERIAHVLGPRGKQTAQALTISTFHSFGLGVLTRERTALGGAFTIFDQGDAIGVVKDILRRIDAGKPFDASAVLTRISNAKNGMISPDEFEEHEGDAYDEIAREAYPRYVEALRTYRAFDFDDLVCEVARLWKTRRDILERWQERYRYVMVDEYQDTNRAQLEVLRLLAATHKNICVVGDDDQSIYGWRGADVRNILEFEEHFPGAEVVKLEQNYRSRAPVLAVANAVIAKRQDSKYRKVLFTERAGGDTVQVGLAATPEVEASWVARDVKKRHVDGKTPLREMAVLYRSNLQSKAIEEALREHAVPHRVLGGQQFFERKEVKDVLAYLKVVLNPADEISLRRVVNYPARGIGAASLERLALHAVARGWTLSEAVERADSIDEVSAAACEGCKAFGAIVASAREDLRAMPPSKAVRALVDRIGLRAEVDVSSPSPKAAGKRWENVEGLIASFARKEDREREKPSASWLASFLHALTLDTSEEDSKAEAGDLVTLSTLHGSKGLEFDVVYLIGCEEGLLPHARTLDARATDVSPQRSADGERTSGPSDIEEERRLFYVGVTRARESLVLTRCRMRVQRGKPMPRTPSRFLADIPPELVEERELRDDPAASLASVEQNANALLAALDALGR
jgi:superfamily I DNA/RNA helicase